MVFEADVKASALKHAITVLQRVNDEGIMQIDGDGMMCRIADAANASMIQVTLPYGTFESYISGDATQNSGLDLDILASWMKRATAKDTIHIDGSGGDRWYLTRGIHQRGMALLKVDKMRKTPGMPELSHTVTIALSGKEFKEIVAEAEDLSKVKAIMFYATAEEVVFSAESEHVRPETYRCQLTPDRFELCPNTEPNTRCIYTLSYLHDVAIDMKLTDAVRLKFGTDLPCKVEYERDGVKVVFILAPRIESD